MTDDDLDVPLRAAARRRREPRPPRPPALPPMPDDQLRTRALRSAGTRRRKRERRAAWKRGLT